MRDPKRKPDGEDRAPVLWISHKQDETCSQCGAALHRGNLVEVRRDRGARCVACAGFADLELLPAGDPALTRRAVKLSTRHAVVVKFSRARGRAERQGVLVEKDALATAERECTADAARRAAAGEKRAAHLAAEDAEYRERFRTRILELFPRCPPEAAKKIADHACQKHSDRVGRTQMAKDLAALRANMPETVDPLKISVEGGGGSLDGKSQGGRSGQGAVGAPGAELRRA